MHRTMNARFRKLKEPKSVAEMSAVECEQLSDAAHHLDGEEHPDLDAFLRDGDAFPEYFAVLRDGEHLYDAWLFSSDDGSLYERGTPDRAPYRVVQGKIELDGSSTLEALVAELQEAYDRRYS